MSITALLTGGSGEIATFTRPHLRERGWTLRLLDPAEPPALEAGESWVEASILDLDAVTEAARGADVLVHYAAHRAERPWADILSLNIDGTRTVLEAAHRAGVRRVLLASSVHAVGFTPTPGLVDVPVPPPRPDTYYGVSKAALEALGSLYADKHDMAVVSARIINATTEPHGPAARTLWFSPGDSARLVAAVAALDQPGHRIVWGVSAGAGEWVDLEPGFAIGYRPVDDGREPGDDLAAALREDPAAARIGGGFTSWPLGETMA
jgi:uronate dehydrogenase